MAGENASRTVPPSRAQPLRIRYIATLLNNLLMLAMGLLTAGVVPRALGPRSYGNLGFLTSFATGFRNLANLGLSQAFYTYSSREERSGPFTRFYLTWLVAQLCLALGVVGLSVVTALDRTLWPGLSPHDVMIVIVMDWTTFLAVTLRQLADSKGLTLYAQVFAAGVSVLNVGGLLALSSLGMLAFNSYVWLTTASSAALSAALTLWLMARHADLCWNGKLRPRVREFVRYSYAFAAPLAVYGAWTMAVDFGERYVIQRLYGPTQQGYYSLALKWSGLVFVFTSSIVPLYWREIANALGRGQRASAAATYVRYNAMMYFLAATLAFYVAFQGRALISLILGQSFSGAAALLVVMAFYPVQQTLWQLNGTVFLASQRTVEYRNLGIIVSVITLVPTYFLLAPSTLPIPGLGLGAMGLAIKAVVVGLLSVQLYVWLNCRFFGLRYGRALMANAVAGLAIFAVALVTSTVLGGLQVRALAQNSPLALSVNTVMYFGGVATLALLFPRLCGLTRQELAEFRGQARSFLSGAARRPVDWPGPGSRP